MHASRRKSGSKGADRNAERFGDFVKRKVKVVVQHDDCAVVDRQPPERALQLVAVRDRCDVIGRGCVIEVHDEEVRRQAPGLPRLGVARTDRTR